MVGTYCTPYKAKVLVCKVDEEGTKFHIFRIACYPNSKLFVSFTLTTVLYCCDKRTT
jgi:hypothetical protein